jgi:hypothetical protein
LSEIQKESFPEQQEATITRKRRGPLARLGCALGLALWAVLILVPCILIALAVQGEINLSTGDAPDQRLRIWLIMEAAQRGLGISNASIHEQDNGQTCVQTDTSFLLWQGQADPVSYCECYQHEDGSKDWTPTGLTPGKCETG